MKPSEINPLIQDGMPADTVHMCANALAFLSECGGPIHAEEFGLDELSGRTALMECIVAALRYEADTNVPKTSTVRSAA